MGGYLARNQTAFFEQVVNVTANVTAPGTAAYNTIHNMRGGSISRTSLESAFYPYAVPQCQKNCNLDSVTFCIGRDAAGAPISSPSPHSKFLSLPGQQLTCCLCSFANDP